MVHATALESTPSSGAAAESGMPRAELATTFQVSEPTIRRWLRRQRERGSLTPDVSSGSPPTIATAHYPLLSFRVFFQCKRYHGSVGASAIRDFRGAMVGRTDKGLLISTGTFTADAQREATRDGAPVLDLIDGEALCQLLKDLKLGVQTLMVEEVTIDTGWFRTL
jgi:restriction system protein